MATHGPVKQKAPAPPSLSAVPLPSGIKDITAGDSGPTAPPSSRDPTDHTSRRCGTAPAKMAEPDGKDLQPLISSSWVSHWLRCGDPELPHAVGEDAPGILAEL